MDLPRLCHGLSYGLQLLALTLVLSTGLADGGTGYAALWCVAVTLYLVGEVVRQQASELAAAAIQVGGILAGVSTIGLSAVHAVNVAAMIAVSAGFLAAGWFVRFWQDAGGEQSGWLMAIGLALPWLLALEGLVLVGSSRGLALAFWGLLPVIGLVLSEPVGTYFVPEFVMRGGPMRATPAWLLQLFMVAGMVVLMLLAARGGEQVRKELGKPPVAERQNKRK